MTDELPTLDPTPDPSSGNGSEFIPPPASPARMPKQIGKFRIKKLIATGGMGAVYQGVQEQPRRTVAIKLMKSGVASASALRRFEYESQLLARLKHPGIAQVYDAGTHEAHDGSVPYFVMEYIAGAKRITDYVRDKKLSTQERLKLFMEVASAVHHGHTKGIIHRDLKPDNILVDSHGRVKVIDFGVARATDSDMAVTTLQTDIGQLIGTVQYMSPEQVEADPDDLDTRSDVYALGVILYQMLTEQLPYDVSKMKVYDATRVVREQEALKLSTINSALRGDIETITLKALEKDRDRRYQSAENLAADIQRYLNDEPIMGRPPSLRYQLQVFGRRHKGVMVGMGAVFVALLLGVVGMTALYFDAEAARLEAVTERQNAESEAEKAQRAVGLLTEMIGAANPTADKGPNYTVRELLGDFAAGLDERLGDQPEVESDIRSVIGHAYRELQMKDEARRELSRALQLRQELFGAKHLKVAESLYGMSRVEQKFGQFERQEQLAIEATEIYRELAPDSLELATTIRWIGNALSLQGKFQEATDRFREAIEVARRATDGGESQILALAMHDSGLPLMQLSDNAKAAGDMEKAEQLKREAVDVMRQAVDIHPRVHGPRHPETAWGWKHLATVLTLTKDYKDAADALEKSLAIRRVIYDPDNPLVLSTYKDMLPVYMLLGRWKDALEIAELALEANPQNYGSIQAASFLYLQKGDLAEHRQRLDQWLSQSAPSNEEAELRRIAFPYLLNAIHQTDSNDPLIKRIVDAFDESKSPVPMALVAYLQGQWAEVTQQLDRRLQNKEISDTQRAIAISLQVMAQYHLATPTTAPDATQRLDEAQALLDASREKSFTEGKWHSLVATHVIIQKARALIRP